MGVRGWLTTYATTVAISSILIGVYLVQYQYLPAVATLPEGYDTWNNVYMTSTTAPTDITAHMTAAITHNSTFHLFRNLTILCLGGLAVERVLTRTQLAVFFVVTAIAGTATYSLTGHMAGVARTGAGASGGTYAVLALAGLVIPYWTLHISDWEVTIPVWLTPIGLTILELIRIVYGWPMTEVPYSQYAHLCGIGLAVLTWILLGRPQQVVGRSSDSSPRPPAIHDV